MAPGTTEPSAKISVGVACTRSFWPSALRLFHRIVAIAGVVGQRAAREERVPCLHLVGRAPDHPRLARRIRVQLVDREQERVDRDVVDLLQLVLELGAEGTIGIGEHDELALAVALDALEGQVERQAGDVDAVQLAQPLLGQVDLAFRRRTPTRRGRISPWRRCRSSGCRTALRTGRNRGSWRLRRPCAPGNLASSCFLIAAASGGVAVATSAEVAARTGTAAHTNAMAATATAAAIRVRNRKIVL